ncbi:MAG TPA: 2,5-dichloro-2,5-cyclohexadiene-1,4-diol dehydrogenase [Porticoccaceae bacterium]|nr:2,5-dichloro-2,5-cyclohexadiene-1,4-diol dehydrogenase [Porticoccaceae bacterium]
MAELEGKVAVITGGASGIGERSVELFVEEGARVVIADMQVERGQALAARLGEAAVFAEVEVRKEEQVKAAVDLAVSTWGRLDCIFNNAGFGGVLGPVQDTPVDEFDMTYDVLVRGVFLGMKHAAPIMKKQKSGSIINTGSIAGLSAGYSPHAYAGAKSAVIHMTKSVAMELGEHNIRVNAICPGFIATPLAANTVGKSDELVDRVKPAFEKSQAIPRAGVPDDIAQMACWLAGGRSTFVTGQAMVVDGGLITGLKWEDQPGFQKSYHPIKVYRPRSER